MTSLIIYALSLNDVDAVAKAKNISANINTESHNFRAITDQRRIDAGTYWYWVVIDQDDDTPLYSNCSDVDVFNEFVKNSPETPVKYL